MKYVKLVFKALSIRIIILHNKLNTSYLKDTLTFFL